MHLNNKQTYRGDLEMLGYNLIVWSGGRLPWEKKNHFKFQHYTITNEKKLAKSNVNEFVKKCFFMKLISPVTLRAICDYMSTIYQLNIDDIPNFDQLRAPIKEIVKALGFKVCFIKKFQRNKYFYLCLFLFVSRQMHVFVYQIQNLKQLMYRIIIIPILRIIHK